MAPGQRAEEDSEGRKPEAAGAVSSDRTRLEMLGFSQEKQTTASRDGAVMAPGA